MKPLRRLGPWVLALLCACHLESMLAIAAETDTGNVLAPDASSSGPPPPEDTAGVRVEVRLEGLPRDLETLMRGTLGITAVTGERLSLPRLRELHAKAAAEIRRALRALGYYQPQIRTRLERRDDDLWRAHYHIEPGEPVRVRKLQLDLTGAGAQDPALTRVLQAFPLQQGERLRDERYEKGKRNLLRLAMDRGYLDARFLEHEIRVFPQEHAADIRLLLDTGPRYHFGPLLFDDTVLERAFLVRYAGIRPGEPFSLRRLTELQNVLYGTDYFSRVEIVPQREAARDHRIPVRILLEPRPRHRYRAGLGYGTDTGPRGSLEYLDRRLNRRGHRLRLQLHASAIRERFSASYLAPYRNPRRDKWAVNATVANEHPDADREERSLILDLGRSVGRGRFWTEALRLRYRRDDFFVGETSGVSYFLLPELTLERIRGRQEARRITRGSRFFFSLRGASTALGSATSFLQPHVAVKGIRPAWRRGDRLLLRVEAAATFGGEFARLPPALRRFAGGDNSVRGYGFQALSPVDAQGVRTGGRHLFTASAEYDLRLQEKWSLAVFWDTGNAFDHWNDFTLEQGAGIGVRWLSPLGPLRIDLAEAVSRAGIDLRLHVVFGPEL